MQRDTRLVAVSFDPGPAGRAIIAAALGEGADIAVLPDLDAAARAAALARAAVLLARNTDRDLAPAERAALAGMRLIQFVPAGIDFIAVGDLPAGVPVASNAGA